MDKERIQLARNSRTACIAFVAFASRYYQGNITEDTVSCMKNAVTSSSALETLLKDLSELGEVRYILPENIFLQKDCYNRVLEELFNAFIDFSYTIYNFTQGKDPTVTASNFLKSDRNYYAIISFQWFNVKSRIKQIFDSINSY